MSNCRTTNCNGMVFNEAVGYCQYCIGEAWDEDKARQPIKVVSSKVSHINKVSQSEPIGVTGVSHTAGDSPTKTCSRCGKPRAVWSKSYCKQCHALRVKEWRTARHTI